MHRIALLAALVVGLPGTVRADLVDAPAARPDPDRGNFWRDLMSPHKEEVDRILVGARQAISRAEMALYSDDDATGTERMRFYAELHAVLAYARKLAPDELEVLALLGQAADEHGKTREALDALHAAIDLVGVDRADAEVTGRLGIIYLRLGRTDQAIRYLRAAEGPVASGQPLSAHVLVHLAQALAARGQMTEAIDLLASHIPSSVQYYPNELVLLTFALAVQYDRDEQRGAAFEVLDKLQTIQQGQLAQTLQPLLAGMRFAPAEDRHYYHALLWEVSGHHVEARAEWALYANAGNQPYRRRALEHIATIDAKRRANPTTISPIATPPHRIRSPRHP